MKGSLSFFNWKKLKNPGGPGKYNDKSNYINHMVKWSNNKLSYLVGNWVDDESYYRLPILQM